MPHRPAANARDPRFALRLRELLNERGLSYRALARRVHYSKTYLHALATSNRPPIPETARRLDQALGAGGELAGLAAGAGTVVTASGVCAERAEPGGVVDVRRAGRLVMSLTPAEACDLAEQIRGLLGAASG